MGITIHKLKDTKGPFIRAAQRLCRTEDGRLVDETDPAAKTLFCNPGTLISIDDARKYGLLEEPKPQPAPVVADPVEEQRTEPEPEVKEPEVKEQTIENTKEIRKRDTKKKR